MTDSGRTTNTASPPEPRLRLFVALWPVPRTRSALAAAQCALPWPPGAKPAAATDLHLTLAFIGSLGADALGTVRAAAAVPGAVLELVLDRLELWQGGIVVLRPSVAPAALLQLQQRLARSLRAAGVPFDARPFTPHVTLGRKAGATMHAEAPRLAWRSRGHVLAVSAGGRYRSVARFD